MPTLTTPAMIRLKPTKPVVRREYAPKATDSGQRITWERETPGYWTGATWGEGTWVGSVTTTREGVIWADGPYPRSFWVTPDDAPAYPVCVTFPAPKRAAYDQPAETMTAARATMRPGGLTR